MATCEASVRDVYLYNDYVYRRDRDRSVLYNSCSAMKHQSRENKQSDKWHVSGMQLARDL